MPYFRYEIRDKNLRLIKDQAFSSNKKELVARLHREGSVILNISDAAATMERRKKMHRKAKTRDLVLFANEMKVLLENGIPLLEALDVAVKQMTSSSLMEAVSKIKKDLESGSSFNSAIAKHRNVFGDLWQYLIEAGEISGQMPFVMEQISALLKSMEQVRKKTINAMVYPAVLAVVAVVAILIFTLKIIPIFKGVYATLGSANSLPALTVVVFSFSDALRQNFAYIAVFLFAVILTLKQLISTKRGRYVYENILLSTPVIGQLYLAIAIEKFSTTLKVLLKSGILIIKAIDMAANTAGSVVFSSKIVDARAKVTAGLPLSDALQQTGFFPPLVIQLTSVGEKTGNFPGMFDEIAKYYNDTIDTTITRFTTLIEPVMLIFMAIVIGILVVAMFLPIFKLANL